MENKINELLDLIIDENHRDPKNSNNEIIRLLNSSNVKDFINKKCIVHKLVKGLNLNRINRHDIEQLNDKNLLMDIKTLYIREEMNHLQNKIYIINLLKKAERDSVINGITEVHNYQSPIFCRSCINLFKKIYQLFIEGEREDRLKRELKFKINKLTSNRYINKLFKGKEMAVYPSRRTKSIDIVKVYNEILSYSRSHRDISILKFEELLFNVNEMKKRLRLEESILWYIHEKEKYLESTEEKINSEDVEEEYLVKISRKCKTEMVKYRNANFINDWQKRVLALFSLCFIEEKFPKEIPVFKKEFSSFYWASRRGKVKNIIYPIFNRRYSDYRTLLHNEIINNKDSDYVEVIVALIKLGANTTLKDNYCKTPLDYVEGDKWDMIYNNLMTTYKRWSVRRAVGLRVLHTIIQYKWEIKGQKDMLDFYCESLINYVLNNMDKKSSEDLHNILSTHIWHEENIELKKAKQDYFLNVIHEAEKEKKENESRIDRESSSSSSSKSKYRKRNRALKRKIKGIETYLLEDGYEKFKGMKLDIENTIAILKNNIYDKDITEKLIKNIENFIKEYPSQIYMRMTNDTDIFDEIISLENIRLIGWFVKYGRNINYFMRDGRLPLEIAIEKKSLDLVSKMIELGGKLEVRNKEGKKLYTLLSESQDDQLKALMKNQSPGVEGDDPLESVSTNELIIGTPMDSYPRESIDLVVKFREEENDPMDTFSIIKVGEDGRNRTSNILIRSVLKYQPISDTMGIGMKKFIASIAKKSSKVDDDFLHHSLTLAEGFIMDGKLEKVMNIIRKCPEVLEIQKPHQLNLLTQIIIILENNDDLNKLLKVLSKNNKILNDKSIAINRVNNTTPLHYLMEKIRQNREAIIILERMMEYVTNVEILDHKNKNGMTVLDYALAINNMEAVHILYERNMRLKENRVERFDNIIHLQYLILNDAITKDAFIGVIHNLVNVRKEDEQRGARESMINDHSVAYHQSLLHVLSYLIYNSREMEGTSYENDERDDIPDSNITDRNYNERDIPDRIIKGGNYDERDIPNKIIISGNYDEKDTPDRIMIKRNYEERDTPDRIKRNYEERDIHDRIKRNYEERRINDKQEIFTYLLEQPNIDLNIEDSEKRTPLFYAILFKAKALIEALIRKSDLVLDTCDRNGASPFHYAALVGDIEIIKLIHSHPFHNKDIIGLMNRKDSNGRTAMHYAAIVRNTEILDHFARDSNVNFNMEDDEGFRPVDYLLLGPLDLPTVKTIKKLLVRNDGILLDYHRNELHTACQNPTEAEKAIQLVVDVCESQLSNLIKSPLLDPTGKTPLDMALERKISSNTLCDLIKKSKLLENTNKNYGGDKEFLLNKLTFYDREDIAKSLGILNEYNVKTNLLPEKLINRISRYREDNEIDELKKILNIPSYIDCRGFKEYEYAIVIDRPDLFKIFYDKVKDKIQIVHIQSVEEKIIKYNALNIVKWLLENGLDETFEFNDKWFWATAGDDIKDTIISYYQENKMIKAKVTQAALNLNVDMVDRILEKTESVISGILHIAVNESSVELAKVVLKHYHRDAFVQQNDYLQTAGHVALQRNDAKMVVFLIMNGDTIKEVPHAKNSSEYSLNENIKKAKEWRNLLDSDLDIFNSSIDKMSSEKINERDILGNTLLFYALEESRDKVEELVKRGAELNIENFLGQQPLYLSICHSEKSIVEYLMENGGNLTIKYKGKSMLYYAMKRKHGNVMEITTKNSIAIKLMEKGIIDLDPSTLNCLVRYDQLFNTEKVTQLMYHIMKENKKNALRLIRSEWIDLTITDDKGITAYGYAKSKKYNDLIAEMKQKIGDASINENIKINKDILGIISRNKKSAINIIGESLMIALGIVSSKNLYGEIAFSIFENIVREKK